MTTSWGREAVVAWSPDAYRMRSMTPLSLSSSTKASRICVLPVLLMAASPAAPSTPLDHAPLAVALERAPAAGAVADAWKSLPVSVGSAPNAPVCTSICKAPNVSKGLVPNTPTRWSRSVLATMTASSGIAEVSNDTKPFSCASLM